MQATKKYNISTIIGEHKDIICKNVTETICRSCGSEKLHVKVICELCSQPINFECIHCGYITDEKVHVDCKNREFLLSATQ
jgi:predicted amidophosphoribosyltransferase